MPHKTKYNDEEHKKRAEYMRNYRTKSKNKITHMKRTTNTYEEEMKFLNTETEKLAYLRLKQILGKEKAEDMMKAQ